MSSIWTIRRSATDSKLTGLCGGIAQHWGVDPVLVRVGCALLALSGGIGLVLYVAGWLLIPVEGKDEAPISDLFGDAARNWPKEVWVAIVAICCIVVFALFGSLTPFGFGPAVILALIWYFGYYKNRQPHQERSPGSLPSGPAQPGAAPVSGVQPGPLRFFNYPGPPTPFTQAADAWRQRVEENARQAAQARAGFPAGAAEVGPQGSATFPPQTAEDLNEPSGPASSLPPGQPFNGESDAYRSFLAAPDPVGLYAEPGALSVPQTSTTVSRATSRPARRLRLLSLVALGLTLSGLAAADALGVAIPTAAYFGAALLVLGLTLVAAAWFGRARGILPVALLLLIATIGASVSGPVAHERHWGSLEVAHTTAAQLAPGDKLELGELRVDLSKLKLASDASYTAHVDVGALNVSVPKNVNVVVNWRVSTGAFLINDADAQAGSDESGTVPLVNPDPAKPTLTLNLSVGRGKLQVRQ